MSKWIDRSNSHALTRVWANLMQLIQDKSLDEGATEDAVEGIARIRKNGVRSQFIRQFASVESIRDLNPFF